MDLPGFFSALFSDWVGSMSGIGSLLLTIIGFVAKARQWKHQFWNVVWLFWSAGLICFFLGSAHVWTIEHQKVTAISGDLERLKYPNLSLKIEESGVGRASSDPNDPTTAVFLIVSLKNTGAPSVADNWGLAISLGNGTVLRDLWPLLTPPGSHMTITTASGPMIRVGSGIDNLYDKAMIPLQQGTKIRGILIFNIPNARPEVINRDSTVLTLTCKDVQDRSVSVAYYFSKANLIPYNTFPGLSPPMVLPPSAQHP